MVDLTILIVVVRELPLALKHHRDGTATLGLHFMKKGEMTLHLNLLQELQVKRDISVGGRGLRVGGLAQRVEGMERNNLGLDLLSVQMAVMPRKVAISMNPILTCKDWAMIALTLHVMGNLKTPLGVLEKAGIDPHLTVDSCHLQGIPDHHPGPLHLEGVTHLATRIQYLDHLRRSNINTVHMKTRGNHLSTLWTIKAGEGNIGHPFEPENVCPVVEAIAAF